MLFSIMIFENYNRGKFKRKLERIKVRSGRHTTVGIMQVGSDADLTDEESINLAYFKLKDEIVRGNIVTDDEKLDKKLAAQFAKGMEISKIAKAYSLSMPNKSK